LSDLSGWYEEGNPAILNVCFENQPVRVVCSVGLVYRIVSNISILASYRYRDNSPPNKMILLSTLVSHVVGNDSH